jgi:DNA ligase (NAD+)
VNQIEKIKKLTQELLHHSYLYYTLDCPEITDTEYDAKFDQLKTMEDEVGFWLANSPTRKVQGEILPYLTKVKHSIPMLSADKSTDIEDVKKFIGDNEVVITFKLDGGTCVVKYNNGQFIQALSRGSGEEGEDITHTAKMIQNLPMTIPYKGYLVVRGEALIPSKYYNEMNKDGTMGHPRNVATGGLRQLDANEAANRNIYFYAFTLVNWRDVGVQTKFGSLGFLEENGFDTSPNMLIAKKNYIYKALDYLDRQSYENPTDGWCVEYNDLAYGESLGSTGHHDRRLFALKPERETVETTLTGVDWTMGKTGILTPTAIMKPVEIDNTIVERASLHNISIMKSLGLSLNGRVSLYKANMIIPQIEACIKDGDSPIDIPKYCPICGGETSIVKENESEVLMCMNSNCTGKLLGKLTHFVSRKAMDIDGVSESTLQFLIDMDWVCNFKDLYHLTEYKMQWMCFDGFGKKSVEKILEAIEKSRHTTLDKFLCALSIPGIGTSASKTLSSYFNGSFDAFIKAFESGLDWTKLTDFGDITARNINNYLTLNKTELIDLANEMVWIMEEKKEVVENPFIGKVICVTGKLNTFNRDSINAKITELGAKAASGVSAKTDYLITNTPNSGSSKNANAKKYGTKIITEEEFLNMIGE